MTLDDVVDSLLEWGYVINPREYDRFRDYVREMFARERVLMMFKEDELMAIILFHITNDYERLYKKGLWDIPDGDPEGHQVYIDKMVCKSMTLPLRRAIASAIVNKYPRVDEGYYHRAPYDRCVKIFKIGGGKFSHGLHSKVS